MKRVVLAGGIGGFALLVGLVSGTNIVWVGAMTLVAGGLGWMLGGTPAGASPPGPHTGAGPDGSGGSGNGGGEG
jgi:hypothetical protein